ncbi:MAG TPA: AMP-binding protein [Pseudonocardiaceae bacterium]|nr:AMP-binding protein [Pseudonocardiaceae bacterium]
MARSRSLLGCLGEHASARPESVAVVMGGERITYGQLVSMSLAAYTRIGALGLPTDARIAVHANKSIGTVALIVACLAGRRPFLLPSTELGVAATGSLLAKAECSDVLTVVPDPEYATGDRVHLIDRTPIDGLSIADAGEPLDGSPDDIAFLLTTSGSTGLPKIVPLSFGAVDRFVDWAVSRFGIGPGTSVLNYAPFNFDLCLLDIRATLKVGATTVMVEPERATNGKYLAELLRANEVDIVQSVPMMFRLLADAYRGEPFTSVRHVIMTGDKVPPRLLGQLPGLFPNATLYNIYGCTETNDSFLHEIDVATDDAAALPIGRPLPGVDAVVVDENDHVLHGPATGELLVSTPFQTTGYLDVNGTAKFVALEDGPRRYFRSGDMVRRDADGVYTLLGRNDLQVKVRGTRVNLAEIEQVLLDHGRVVEAAAVGVPDDLAGVRIHAVVRGSRPPLDVMALREHCRLRLPRAALPAAYQLVDQALPMTSTGKVDRKVIIRDLLNRS